MEPIDMILYCPNCGKQHIDAPNRPASPGLMAWSGDATDGLYRGDPGWTNPPHRSHKCAACGCIWRPADVATNGVADIHTNGRADTWVVYHGEIDASAAKKRVKEMAFYTQIEENCLTDRLDYEHRRCNTTRLKKLCDMEDLLLATAINKIEVLRKRVAELKLHIQLKSR